MISSGFSIIGLGVTSYHAFAPLGHLYLQNLQNLAGRLATSTVHNLPLNIKESIVLFLLQLQAADRGHRPTPTIRYSESPSPKILDPTTASNIKYGVIGMGCCAFLAIGTGTIVIIQCSRRSTYVAPSSRQLRSATRAERSTSFNGREGSDDNENDEERSNSGRSSNGNEGTNGGNEPDPVSEPDNPSARSDSDEGTQDTTSLRVAQGSEDPPPPPPSSTTAVDDSEPYVPRSTRTNNLFLWFILICGISSALWVLLVEPVPAANTRLNIIPLIARVAITAEDHLVIIEGFKSFITTMLISNQSIATAVSNASLSYITCLIFFGFIISGLSQVLSLAFRPRLERTIARSDNDSQAAQLQNTVNTAQPDSLKDKALSIFTFDELVCLSKEILASERIEIKSDSEKKTTVFNFNPSAPEFVPIQREPLVGSSSLNPTAVVGLTDTSVVSPAPRHKRRNHRNRGRGRLAVLRAAALNDVGAQRTTVGIRA